MRSSSSLYSLPSSSSSFAMEEEEEEEAGGSSYSSSDRVPLAYPSSSCAYKQRRRMSFKAVPVLGSPELLLYDDRDEPPHFLDSCFLCNRRIGRDRDIFMYRGDTPFCSEECREKQIERDESEERMRNLSLRMKAAAFRHQNNSSSSTPSDILFRAGTTVAG